MKAIVQERFGPPDVLQLVDTGLPGHAGGCERLAAEITAYREWASQ